MRRRPVPADRVLVTVLFTDIVGSTERAAAEGDARWRKLLDGHDDSFAASSRASVAARSRPRATASWPLRRPGAGGPVCAQATAEGVRRLGLRSAGRPHGRVRTPRGRPGRPRRAHGARVMGLAGPGEVLASSTVKDLVVGSGSSSRTAVSTSCAAPRAPGGCTPPPGSPGSVHRQAGDGPVAEGVHEAPVVLAHQARRRPSRSRPRGRRTRPAGRRSPR